MSDQKEIETSRYARKTVTVRGLMQGTHDPNAKKIMAEHGIMWDLSGRTDMFEESTVTMTTHLIEGEEIPSTFTTHERQWVLALAETHGLDAGIVEEEKTVVPDVPYIGTPVRFATGNGWTDLDNAFSDGEREFNATSITLELHRHSRRLAFIIEGKSKDDVANPGIDAGVQSALKKVRDALKAAGFTEGELEIDCEVIMGAEREAQCDPDLMRSLLTTDEEREEE